MKLALLDDYQAVASTVADWSRLPEGWHPTVFHDRIEAHETIVERLLPFDVVMVMRERTRLTRSILEGLPQLQMIVNAGMNAPGIDVEAATDFGVLVCGTPTRGEGPTQHAWALLLGLVRHLNEEDRGLRAGEWGSTLGMDLAARTMGLIGLGKIGAQMAQIANAFGMQVVAWSENLTAERAAEQDAQLVTKDELFRQADVVSLHLRLSERTRGVVGARELGLMKRSAVLVNMARGALVDEAALVAALSEGRIAGAGLDVFATEPLPPGHPLMSLSNTLLTPHVGYVTDVRYQGYYEGTIDCVRALASSSPIRVMNPEVLDSPTLRAALA